MRRYVSVFIMVIGLFFCFEFSCAANQYPLSDIQLPPQVSEQMGKLPENSEQLYAWFDVSSMFSRVEEEFGDAFSAAVRCFFCLVSVSVLSATMTALSESIENKGVITAFEYIAVLGAALVSISFLQSVFIDASEHLQTLSVFASGVIPVYSGICTAAGMNGLSLASGGGLSLMASFVSLVASGALLPLLRICFVLGFSASVSDVAGIGQIAGLVRRFFMGAIGAVAALLTAVFAFQTGISAKADSMAGRAFRYVASSSLPLVGGALSEASRTLSSAFSLMSGVSGGVGVVCVLVLMIPVMMELWALRLAFSLAGAVSDILNLPRLSLLYRDESALLGSLMAILAQIGRANV